MEFQEFKLVKTQFLLTVEPFNDCGKEFTSAPSDFVVLVNHSLCRDLYVVTDDGDVYPAENHESPKGTNSISFDSSLFAFKDEFVHPKVCKALSMAGVNSDLWEVISEKVTAQGIEMLKGDMEVYRVILVDLVTVESFVCYEDAGEC